MNDQAEALKLAIQETFRDAKTCQEVGGLPQIGDQLVAAIEKLVEARVSKAISLG